MPIIFEGKHICEKCNKRFHWVYFEPRRSRYGDGIPVAEAIPNSPKAYVEAVGNNMYKVCVACEHCRHNNNFIYETSL